MSRMAMLIDASKCTACRGCQVACKQWWDNTAEVGKNTGTYENPPDLNFNTWTKIKFNEDMGEDGKFRWLFTKQGCMHCGEPACVKVCPTHALKKQDNGTVSVERDLCNGCGYCRTYCPFDIPRIDLNVFTGSGKSYKCNFCQDRTTNGELPACVKTCPSGALEWGDREAMLAKAEKRVEVLKANGDPNAMVYGEKRQNGDKMLEGTGRIYVLREGPKKYGLPEDPTFPVMANTLQDWVHPLSGVAFGLMIVAMGGLSAIGAVLTRKKAIKAAAAASAAKEEKH